MRNTDRDDRRPSPAGRRSELSRGRRAGQARHRLTGPRLHRESQSCGGCSGDLEDVTSERPLSVRVEGPVAIAPSSAVQARALPQAWEYRTVSVKAGEDLGAALAEPGTQGWEAAGTYVPANGSPTAPAEASAAAIGACADLGHGPSMMSP